jgi:3',5'-cyclic AMP phosphodiesterase CpdA
MHFGPRHWFGSDLLLAEAINSFAPDLVIDTGDCTTDGLESEYTQARDFFQRIACANVIHVIGNHDKRNNSCQDLYKKYIDGPDVISPCGAIPLTKPNLYLDRTITRVKDNFTDFNFIKSLSVSGKTIAIIGIDPNVLLKDNGFVEPAILAAVSDELESLSCDFSILLTHYPLLGTDTDPFENSRAVLDLVNRHHIDYVLCGHDHYVCTSRYQDLCKGHGFYHLMCGATGTANIPRDDNVFMVYENMGTEDFKIQTVHLFPDGDKLDVKTKIVI